ncbi:MAG TPA: amino acid adenylation domain-containing protein [Streptosporangiaceae bacterium]|jgi:amino acid adenylation domain-containing protein/FkbM family methyltransferase
MTGLIHDVVGAQMRKWPDRVAVELENDRLTYAQLWRRVRDVAGRLRAEGVGPGSVVAVGMERCLDLPVALLGVLAAGGAYLPLEPGLPVARLAFMLRDSGARVLVTRARDRTAMPGFNGRVVLVDEAGAGDDAPDDGGARPGDLAYVIYTSGSTGEPKGVMNTHAAIANRLAWAQDAYGLTGDDRVLQKTPIGFDVSVWELFWPLMAGARLVLARPGGHRDPAYLVDVLRRAEVTTLHFVPSMLRVFLDAPGVEDCRAVRRVICSGEALTPDVAERFFVRLPGAGLHNLYGPTEAAVDVTAWECRPGDPVIPIGFPIANTRVHVVDAALRPVAPGAAGELLIGGVAPARGYIGRPALTAERFIPDHLSGRPGARLYRTGDRARWRDDGALEYLGRLDDQVKIRGVRVEPDEVAAVLARHDGVSGAAATAWPDATGQPRLVGYAVPDPERSRPVAGLLRAERAGVPAVRHDLPDGRTVLVPNQSEARFLDREIFDGERYAALGVDPSPGGHVVDVGAHVGVFSLFAAGRGATVYAFEPIPPLFELLRRNTAAHGIDARLFPYGLGDREGEAEFTHYPNLSIMSGRYADPEEDRAVVRAYLGAEPEVERLLDRSLEERRYVRPVRTLSGMLREAGVDRVDLLKIDAEKSEELVIAGVDDADWPRIDQVLVEVHNTDGRLDRLVARLTDLGYRVRAERDPMLDGTGLVMLGAVRTPRAPARPRARTPTRWASPARLVADLRRHAREALPDAMVPAEIVLLEEFPLTPNGKLDRRALPAPPARLDLTGTWTPPEGEAEERLAAIWSALLGRDKPGADDDFFDLGGNSLLANRVVTRVRTDFGVDLPLEEVFTGRTIRRVAAAIAAAPPAGQALPELRPADRDGPLPLSHSQQRLWFLQQLHPGIRAYQFQATIELTGALDEDALSRALTEIVRRHEIYRTTFTDGPEGPRQVIHPPFPVAPPLDDVSGADAPETAARDVTAATVAAEIPVDRLPLVFWRLIRLAPDRHILLHVEHHLVHDGWAFNVFAGELYALYAAYATGRPAPLAEPEAQFADFAVWQRSWLDGPEGERQLAYWRSALAGAPDFLDLPTDHPRTPARRFTGDAPRFAIPAGLADRVRELARAERVTLFTVMLAAFEVLLCHWSGMDDFCLGTGIAGRRERRTEQMLGMLINTVALRADLRGDPPFRELLARARSGLLGAQANQDVPFDRVVTALRPERVPGRHPLCQVMFAFHDAPMPYVPVPGLDVRVTPGIANGTAKVDMNVIAIPEAEQEVGRDAPGGIELIWEYDGDLFDARTVTRAAELYRRLLSAVVAEPGVRISELVMGVP